MPVAVPTFPGTSGWGNADCVIFDSGEHNRDFCGAAALCLFGDISSCVSYADCDKKPEKEKLLAKMSATMYNSGIIIPEVHL